jgi:hypothetical protein
MTAGQVACVFSTELDCSSGHCCHTLSAQFAFGVGEVREMFPYTSTCSRTTRPSQAQLRLRDEQIGRFSKAVSDAAHRTVDAVRAGAGAIARRRVRGSTARATTHP